MQTWQMPARSLRARPFWLLIAQHSLKQSSRRDLSRFISFSVELLNLLASTKVHLLRMMLVGSSFEQINR
ncbi:hypothetical protein XarCFBP6771_14725 [Xanthomonas arboricola]|nr:hypothetical protein XarCFBP6771_14725 [Xanthomonas arboricola]PPT59101.1 hypothetical protein XarbCFBP8153_13150 [Xanthomonas arboricola]